MAPKKGGKKVLRDVVRPCECPEDLPDGFELQFTWRKPQNNKMVLLETNDQGSMGYCWTYSINTMIAAHFYVHDKTSFLLELSPKHLFAHIEERFANGFLKNYKGVKTFLRDVGLVRVEECKCIVGKEPTDIETDACDRVKDKKVFKIKQFVVVEKDIDEKQIIQLLKKHGLVSCEIQVTDAYKGIKKSEIYFGPSPKYKVVENHIVTLSGWGTDEKGISYFQFQNSWGIDWGGDEGYGKFARKVSLKGRPSLIKSYMYPKILEETFDV